MNYNWYIIRKIYQNRVLLELIGARTKRVQNEGVYD